MKHGQLASKNTLSRMKEQVTAAWEIRDLRKCVEVLQRMNRLIPADRAVLLELGRMQGLVYNYESAKECFERAHRLAPQQLKAQVLAGAGQLARDFYSQEISEWCFQRAIQEKDATPDVFVKLAEIFERGQRMDEAWSLVERALHRDPQFPFALFARAHLQHRAGKLDEAEQNLRSLLKLATSKEIHVRAWYELGAILDRGGRYDEAMQAFLAAKSLVVSDAAPYLSQRKATMQRVSQMRQSITPAILRRWFDSGCELQPARRLALLGGHPRSGTTLLEQVLDSHPDIVSAEETDHFQDYVARPINRRWPTIMPILQVLESASRDDLASYRNDYFRVSELCLGSPLGNRLLIDKNPSQTLSVPALSRVFPEIKFLVALRDPRDVVLSCFMQPMWPIQHVNSTWLSLGTLVDEYVELMGTWKTLAAMLPNPYLEVRYEDMVHDLEPIARRVLDFLGIPWDERVLGFDEHARQKRVRSPTYADVTQKIFTRAMGRWRNYQKYIEPHLGKLEPLVNRFRYE
jgi:tetratricopeptide (TPR) repeat protein